MNLPEPTVNIMQLTKSLKRRCLLLATCLLLLPLSAPLVAAQHEKTNVVLILIDDLGWKDLGCYGSTYSEFTT